MTYVLDTNACVEHLRGRASSAFEARLASATARDEVVLCSVVKGELIYGAWRSRDATKNLAETAAFMGAFDSLPFDDRSAEIYGEIRADLTKSGNLIGPNDLLISAIALANDLTLVTHNVQEFSRVPGLRIEDWQSP
jgi:tRNA(fMet)-specific endonuclease VapC